MRSPKPGDGEPHPLGEPEIGPGPARTEIAPVQRSRSIRHDLATDETVVTIADENGTYRLDAIGWEVSSRSEEIYRIKGDDPLTAEATISWLWSYRRAGWQARTETSSRLACSGDRFVCTLATKAFEGDDPVFARDWRIELPRDLL